MPTHAEKKILPHRPDQMFDLVIDVERYPEFLPWCQECRIISQSDGVIMASLVVGYKLLREWFNSRVTYERPNSIRVEYINGPLRYLSNTWDFSETPEGGCLVDFYVDFEFKNPIFQKLMGVFFNEIVKRMVGAFEARANQLYGTKTKTKSPPRAPKKKEA
jgi:coenzyme Q-binding protein COQ10